MLTKFGRLLRTLRIEKDLNLGQLASDIGVSSPMLSAMEHGKKNVSEEHIRKIAATLRLNALQFNELQKAAEASKVEYKVVAKNLKSVDRELVCMFARSIEGELLTSDQSERIKQILEETV